jgi:hypothetical protein
VSALIRYALPGIIVLSALGALLMSLLVVRYGFPTGDEDPGESNRRLLVTRVGHALAGVCFAAAAILAVVAVPARVPAPAAPDTADAGAVARLAEDVRRIEDRLNRELATIEERLSEARSAPRERAVAEPPSGAETPPVVARPPVAATPPVVARSRVAGRPAVTERPPAAPLPSSRPNHPPGRPAAPAALPVPPPTARGEDASALPADARLRVLRATVQNVHVDVRSRPGPGGTEWLVQLTDGGGRPLAGADVTLHGRTASGEPVEVSLQAAAEPGAYRGLLPGRGGMPDDLRLRVVRHDKRFDLSLGHEVSW